MTLQQRLVVCLLSHTCVRASIRLLILRKCIYSQQAEPLWSKVTADRNLKPITGIAKRGSSHQQHSFSLDFRSSNCKSQQQPIVSKLKSRRTVMLSDMQQSRTQHMAGGTSAEEWLLSASCSTYNNAISYRHPSQLPGIHYAHLSDSNVPQESQHASEEKHLTPSQGRPCCACTCH